MYAPESEWVNAGELESATALSVEKKTKKQEAKVAGDAGSLTWYHMARTLFSRRPDRIPQT